jgi:hypothetical protein
MAYTPNETANIENVEQLRQWLLTELRAISKELNETTALELRDRFVEPVRPRSGMIVATDATKWNPGAGAGIYGRVGGAWVKLS